MRRFFVSLIFALLFSTLYAQVEKSIIIDPNTFRPVQTDALTGVNIDPIELDYSKRPCARLKVKINRMTVAEIDQLKVKVVTNNAVMKTQTAQYDTGLIIEMTAKPNTRFYFNHPEFGDSNEVCLNLDANKEYYIEAYLNQLYSIVVNSNVAEAEVYIDNVFKGYTDNSNSLVIKDMLVGDHTLKVVYGGMSQEQKIVVNSGSISFRQYVNTSASKPQFVVFSVMPQSAVLTIDGKYQTLYDGVCSIVLPNGTYNYSVSAKNYHTKSGSFVVSGGKVEKQVTLDPAFGWIEVAGASAQGASVYVDDAFVGKAPLRTEPIASGRYTLRIVKELYKPYIEQVVISDNNTTFVSPTLTANYATVQLNASDAEILVNGRVVGKSSWSGQLAPGTYLFESRKENHRNGMLSQSITTDVAHQSYTLPAPTPITGSMLIMTTPAMANVVMDGKFMGRTPIELNDVVVGKHLVTIAKDGYIGSTNEYNVVEGKTESVNIVLQKGSSSVSTTPAKAVSGKSYKVGDLYNENGVKGVVFSVSADGKSGKIVSMTESEGGVLWVTSSYQSQAKLIGLNDQQDGERNMEVVMRQTDWRNNYPAFNYCANLGSGWYLPAVEELSLLLLNDSVHDTVNRTLEANGGTRLYNKGEPRWYWTSTEGSYVTADKMKSVKLVRMNYKDVGEHGKNLSYNFTRVRAIRKFGNSVTNYTSVTPSSGSSLQNNTSVPTGGYKVGDYYNHNGLQGVVFEVSADGKSGKIVSLQQSGGGVLWANTPRTQKSDIGTTNMTDGQANMDIVRRQPDWRQNYPAFAYCADLGVGWYLPSCDEARKFLLDDKIHDAVNATLERVGGTKLDNRSQPTWYWTSTEGTYISSKGMHSAMLVRMNYNDVSDHGKDLHYTFTRIRAVAKFSISGGNYTQSSNYSTAMSRPASSGRYKVGDIYVKNGVKGVVIDVDATGLRGKIVSVECSDQDLTWASTSTEQSRYIGASSDNDGEYNQRVVMAIKDWQSKYPAFAWCANLGSGWYLPSNNEWKLIYNAKSKIESKLSRNIDTYFWTSTEANEKYKGEYCAWNLIGDKHSTYCKSRTNKVFAVAKFDESSSNSSTSTINYTKVYKVGDYYDDGVKQGVVFAVYNGGKNGKIVSLKHAKGLYWTSDSTEQSRFIGANSYTDGMANMNAVKRIDNWKSKYPAFRWCANLGNEWYLPAKEEVRAIIGVNTLINKTLEAKGGDKIYLSGDMEYYISSTEDASDPSYIYIYRLMVNSGARNKKDNNNNTTVRAIAKF